MVYVLTHGRRPLARNVLLELSCLEHEQWSDWSRDLSVQLQEILNYFKLSSAERVEHEQYIIDSLKTRLDRWQTYWKPFDELPDEVQAYDLVWAEKVLDAVPTKCPVWQCGGFMAIDDRLRSGFVRLFDWLVSRVSPLAKDRIDSSWQMPDLVCENCGAVYKFAYFKKRESGDDG